MKKISPRVDIAFKKIFGVDENKDLLISLINSIVSEEDQVTEVILLNPYNAKNFYNDKFSILDIKAKGRDGKRFNIEIQLNDEGNYDKRALYYWAKLYSEQLGTSDDYGVLSKAIGIHILNFTSILGVEKYHNVFHISEKKTGYPYFTDLELHTIELKKFLGDQNEQFSDIAGKVKNGLDIWVAFLTRHDLLNKDSLPLGFDTPTLKKALNVLEEMNFDDKERNAYEEHLKWFRSEAGAIKKNKIESFIEGKAEGLIEGEAKGKAEGLIEGEAKGKAEGKAEGLIEGEAKGKAEGLIEGEQKKAKCIAEELLSTGMTLDTVSRITGLSIEELEKITVATQV